MKRLIKCAFTSALLLSVTPAFATPEPVRIVPDGGYGTVTFGAGELPNKVVFYATERGNESTAFKLSVYAPKKTKVKLSQKRTKKPPLSELSKKKGFVEMELLTSDQSEAKHDHCMDIHYEGDTDSDIPHLADYPPSWNEYCEAYGYDSLQEVADAYNEAYEPGWTPEHVCTYIMSFAELDEEWLDSFYEEPEEHSLQKLFSKFGLTSKTYQYRGVLSRNTCKKGKKAKHVIKIELSFKDVPEEVKAEGATLRVSLGTNHHGEGQESSIKPESEGRYAPRPIILMNYLDSVCGHRIDTVKWKKKNKVQWRKDLEVYSLLAYQDMVLSLALVDSVLPDSGKATFELYNGTSAYSVCFELKQKRQTANGYPK